ncbi:MAG TPA: 50S ribosomal protein L18 [Thermoanaerobaculia bacterium]|nr:50S ribosomal protein L18 [Thermoanaerobaculia bacterium]
MTEHLTKQLLKKRARRERAHLRVRQRVHGTAVRPRLSVYKSLRFIYAQIIDDDRGVTLAQANSMDADLKAKLSGGAAGIDAAKVVGAAVAERAKANGVDKVVFDRGGYVYHGKVKALADSARENGLQF